VFIITEVDISYLISIFAVYYRNISVQTHEDYDSAPPLNSDAEILFNEFEIYSELASDELDSIVALRSITLTNMQKYVALSHLVADYLEMGNPDWNFRSQSMGSGVSFSRGEKTAPRDALDKMLDQIEKASKATRIPSVRAGKSGLVYTKDHKNYPRRYKRTQIPAFDFSEDGFDSEEMSDNGNYQDPLY
jgi:hypothetical protein